MLLKKLHVITLTIMTKTVLSQKEPMLQPTICLEIIQLGNLQSWIWWPSLSRWKKQHEAQMSRIFVQPKLQPFPNSDHLLKIARGLRSRLGPQMEKVNGPLLIALYSSSHIKFLYNTALKQMLELIGYIFIIPFWNKFCQPVCPYVVSIIKEI